MPLLNYRTTIEAEKTVAEIQKILVRAGAKRVMMEYENGEPSGLTFEIAGEAYALPCRPDNIEKVLEKQGVRSGLRTREQALRVAWRIIKDWIEAQLAIIAAGLVSLDEVMLPYVVVRPGRTMYAVYKEERADRMLEQKP